MSLLAQILTISRTMSSNSADAFIHLVDPSSTANAASSSPEHLWTTARTASSKKALDTRIVYGQGPSDAIAALVSLGEDFSKGGRTKSGVAKREVVRKAAGKGVGALRDLAISGDVRKVEVGGGPDAHAAGECYF